MKKNFVILKEKVLLFFKKKKKIQILKEKVSFEQAKFEIGNKSRDVKKGFGKSFIFYNI